MTVYFCGQANRDFRVSHRAAEMRLRAAAPCRGAPGVALVCAALAAGPSAHAVTRTWTGLGDGTSWNQATNWDTGVPLAGDDVVIPNVAPTTVVVFGGPSVAIATLTSSEPFRVAGGALTVDGPGSSTFSQLEITGGTLAGAGPLTISGSFAWSGGTVGGTGAFSADGGIAISGAGSKTLSTRTLTNAGAATFAGAGTLSLSNNAIWNNSTNATFLIQNTASITFSVGGTFKNAGTLQKTSTGTSTLAVPVNNTGLVDVDAGTLSLTRGGTSTGDFDVAGGAALMFQQNHAINAGASVTGAGSLIADGVTFTDVPVTVGSCSAPFSSAMFSGTSILTCSGAIDITGGSLTFNPPASGSCAALTLSSGALRGGGPLTAAGLFAWTGGTIDNNGVLNADGGAAISGTATKSLNDGTLNNAGLATFAGTGGLAFSNGGVWNNELGATFEIQTAASLTVSSGGTFNNDGTLRKISTGTSNISVPMNNDGLVDVDAGTLTLSGTGTHSGDFDIAAGTAVQFFGTQAVNAPSALGGAGVLSIVGGTTTFTDAPSGAGNLAITGSTTTNFEGTCHLGTLHINNLAAFLEGAGTLNVSGLLTFSLGQIRGTGVLNASGGVALVGSSGANKRLRARTLNNAATATIAGANSLLFSNGATWNNLPGSTLLIEDTAQFSNELGVGQSFNNQGTVCKTTAGTASLNVDVTNEGLFELQAGALQCNVPLVQTAGETRLAGGALIKNAGPVELQGGLLSGSGTITGAVNNTGGTVAPGLSAGQLTITSTYMQGPGGTLAIEVGGVTAGTDFDRLSVGGAATLGGTLNATLINGFSPACTDLFRFLAAASRSGTFATVTPCVQDVVYSANAVDVAFDVVAPTVTTPDSNLSVFSDAGTCEYASAGMGLGATANDPCNGVLPVTVTRSDSLPLTDPYPVGVTTLTYSATDDCGNSSSILRTVTVDPRNRVVADVQLGSVAPGTTTRCVTFEFFDGSCPTPIAEESLDLTFVNGTALAAIVLPPCGPYTCITARDRKHTLRRADGADFDVVGRDFASDFTATGGDGDDALVGGNMNDDAFIDIIDFAIYVNRFGVNYGVDDTLCTLPGFHADISADGLVDTADFTFVQVNFLTAAEPDCCGLLSIDPKAELRTSIAVGELWQLGLESLAPADLTADGVIDAADIANFLAGGRPGATPDSAPETESDSPPSPKAPARGGPG